MKSCTIEVGKNKVNSRGGSLIFYLELWLFKCILVRLQTYQITCLVESGVFGLFLFILAATAGFFLHILGQVMVLCVGVSFLSVASALLPLCFPHRELQGEYNFSQYCMLWLFPLLTNNYHFALNQQYEDVSKYRAKEKERKK